MNINNNIISAINNNDTVVITGDNQHRALDIMDGLVDGVGKTLSNGSVSYQLGDKRIFVGDMPEHPSLQGAKRITV